MFTSFSSSHQARCHEAITECRGDNVDKEHCECICGVLSSTANFFMNIVMCVVLFCGLVCNTVGMYAKYQILRGHYFRYTNLILINQSLQYIIMPPIWWLVSFSGDSPCKCKYGIFIWMMPIMGGLLLICYIWGRYYANKLDYARTVQFFLEADDDDADHEAELQDREAYKLVTRQLLYDDNSTTN